ncbi:unnamed protein product, partial [Mesorhabditis belari]|uniref:Uncharacterized protein n=1 Tax=Mesorhabditis belari TaxID=2138241 RepID=A0AAF3JB50_9BILA
MRFLIALYLVTFLRFTFSIKCWMDSTNGKTVSEQAIQQCCVCGNSCVSFPSNGKYIWSCGCLVQKSGITMDACENRGDLRFECCTDDLCNTIRKADRGRDEIPSLLAQSFAKMLRH